MRDIEKTNMAHEANLRRIRRRRRGRSAYVLLVILFATALLVTLSRTIFFNIEDIQVTGDKTGSTAEQIASAIGVKKGDNMMRLHLDELELKAEETLTDVETVDIRREFPSTLVIDVQKSVPAFNISYEYGTLIVSQHGKILQDSMDPVQGLVSIAGYIPDETTPGKRLSATEERCDKIFTALQEIILNQDSESFENPENPEDLENPENSENLGLKIVSVDMSDFNNILINFDHRILFNMGNWSEIAYKINFAQQVIATQPEEKEGYLTMIGSNQCSFRSRSDVENHEKRLASQGMQVNPENPEIPDNSDNSDYYENQQNPVSPESAGQSGVPAPVFD